MSGRYTCLFKKFHQITSPPSTAVFAMKNLFFLERMYCKNDIRLLLYIYQPLFGQKKLKLLKRSHTGEKCHPSIYAEPYRLNLGQNCKNESCSARRFKYKSAFTRSKDHNLEKNKNFVHILNLRQRRGNHLVFTTLTFPYSKGIHTFSLRRFLERGESGSFTIIQ